MRAAAILLRTLLVLGAVPSPMVPVAAAQKAFVAATNETVFAKLELSQGARIGHDLWIQNNSTVSVTITGVRLSNCTNIRQFCGTHKVNVKVPPSNRRRVFRIERDAEGRSSDFRYTYSWSADSNSTAALTALAQSGSQEASARLEGIRRAEEVRKREVGYADLDLFPNDVAELGERIVSLRAEPDSFVVPMDSTLYVAQLRVLAIDSLGQSLGRYRASYRFRMEGSAVRFTPPDSLVPVEPGRMVIILSPGPEVNRTRTKLLEPVRFTIIVPPAP